MSWRWLCGRVMQWLSSRPSGRSRSRRKREVRRVVADADVLGQADRADRVEAGLDHVAVVEVTHLGEVAEPLAVDRLLAPSAPAAATGSRRAPGRRTRARRAGPSRPSRSRRRAAAARASGRACGRPGRTSRTAPPRASRRRWGRPRRCRSSTARAPARRTVGDVVVVADHLGVAAHRVPHALHRAAPARQAPPRGGGGGGRRLPRPRLRTSASASDGRGRTEAQVVLQEHQRVVGVTRDARRSGRGRRRRRRAPSRGRRGR